MIQRIQTVYLFFVAVVLIVCMCMPVSFFIGPEQIVSKMTNLAIVAQDGSANYAPWALFVILLVSAALALFTIFLFKKRMLQIRLTVFSTILLIGYYITLGVFIYMLKGDAHFRVALGACLPFIAIVLNWLAIRAIGKDEMLVKAYERLR